MSITIQKEPEDLIRAYMHRELRLRSLGEVIMDFSMPVLAEEHDTFEMSDCYGIYKDEVMAGFAITSSIDPEVLVRLYVAPAYRRLGLGKAAVNTLSILSVAVLKRDRSVAKFYASLGFHEDPQALYHPALTTLVRTL